MDFEGPFFGRQQDETSLDARSSGSSLKGRTIGQGPGEEQDQDIPSEHSRLLSSETARDEHGTFGSRIRPRMSRRYDSFSADMVDSDSGSGYPGDSESIRSFLTDGPMVEAIESVMAAAESEGAATAKRIASRHNIRGQKRMYIFREYLIMIHVLKSPSDIYPITFHFLAGYGSTNGDMSEVISSLP